MLVKHVQNHIQGLHNVIAILLSIQLLATIAYQVL